MVLIYLLLPLCAPWSNWCCRATYWFPHYFIFQIVARHQAFCVIDYNFLFMIEELPVQLFMFNVFLQCITNWYRSRGPNIPWRSATYISSKATLHTSQEIIIWWLLKYSLFIIIYILPFHTSQGLSGLL